MNGSAALATTRTPLASDERLFILEFVAEFNGIQWQEELADTASDAFNQTALKIEQRLGRVFRYASNVHDWYIVGLANYSFALKVRTHVQTTMKLSAEDLGKLLLTLLEKIARENETMFDIVVEELYTNATVFPESTETSLVLFPVSTALEIPPLSTTVRAISPVSTTPQISPESTETSLALFPVSTTLQISPLSTTVQAISSVLTTPQISTVSFSSVTFTASASIDPSIAEEVVTSSKSVDVFTTKPTIPADSVKFAVSMKVSSYNYTPEMANPESPVFRKIAGEIENELYIVLCVQKLQGCIAIEVTSLEKGSVIVAYSIHMASSTKYKRSQVQGIIKDTTKNGELGRLKVSNVVVQKEKEAENSGSPSPVFIYVLCGVGALLFIALIIFAVSKVRKLQGWIRQI